jgi:mannose-6-phosphate isomerase-like protein (cupin superfamily)
MKGMSYMYNPYKTYSCPYCANISDNNSDMTQDAYRAYPCPYYISTPPYNPDYPGEFADDYLPFTDVLDNYSRADLSEPVEETEPMELKDYGPAPFVVNINEATKQNDTYRTALWTGRHLQVTLMSIKVGEDIGLEIHPNLDQFIRIEEGQGIVKMGDRRDKLDFQEDVFDDFAFVIPAGKWHNLVNTGDIPLKLYSIYAPPQHPRGTVHETKADAMAAEKSHRHK